MRFLRVLAAVLSLSLVMGCTKKQNGSHSTAREPLILWSYYEPDTQKDSMDRLILNFNTMQTKYRLEWKYIPMDEFTRQLSIGLTEGKLPDLVMMDNPDMPVFIRLGLFEDITDYAGKLSPGDFEPTAWNSVQQDGRFYGLPFCSNSLALFYRPDLLKEAGVSPPKNWEELVETAGALTKGKQYGFAMSGIKGEQSAFQMMAWILAAGESPEAVGGEKTEQAFALIRRLLDAGALDQNCINWSQIDVARKFISGEAAMIENGPWIFPLLRQSGVPYEIVPLPMNGQGAIVSGGENISVVKGGNRDGALAFIDYYYREDVMLEVSKNACGLPPRLNAAKSMAEDEPEYAVFVSQIERYVSRSAIPDWGKISPLLSDAFYQTVAQGAEPGTAAAGIRVE